MSLKEKSLQIYLPTYLRAVNKQQWENKLKIEKFILNTYK